jgi:hypothetical protein
VRLGVRPYVDFLGVRRDVSDLLPHITVFALSSVREGLPVALLEAMACGITVVATAVGEVPRVIENGVSGRTVPPGIRRPSPRQSSRAWTTPPSSALGRRRAARSNTTSIWQRPSNSIGRCTKLFSSGRLADVDASSIGAEVIRGPDRRRARFLRSRGFGLRARALHHPQL